MKENYAEKAVITTRSGRHVDLLLPSVTDICMYDIASSLSEQRRFTGHTPRPYTVAEHCLTGLEFCTPGVRFEFLMHDATEAYLGDVCGPLKSLRGMQFYRDLETIWAGVIADRFGLPRKMSAEVHTVDKRMLATELRDLMGKQPGFLDKYKPFNTYIRPVAPAGDHLAERFLTHFYSLAAKTPGAIR